MQFVRLSIIPLLMALAACGQSADPAPQQREVALVAANDDTPEIPVSGPERRILAFGDSLFAGYGLGETEGYPERLQASS